MNKLKDLLVNCGDFQYKNMFMSQLNRSDKFGQELNYEYEQHFSKNDTFFFMLIQHVFKYFSAMFIIENDEVLERAWNAILFNVFFFGSAGLTLKAGEPFVGGVTKRSTNSISETTRFDMVCFSYDDNKSSTTTLKNIVVGKNGAHFQIEQYAIPFWVFSQSLLTSIINNWKALENNLVASQLKIIFHLGFQQKDSYAEKKLRRELSRLKTFDQFYVIMTMKPDERSQFDSQMTNTIANEQKPLIESLEWRLHFLYELIGKRDNPASKKERNLVGELGGEMIGTDVIENYMYNWLKLGVEQYNKSYNKEARLVKYAAQHQTQNNSQEIYNNENKPETEQLNI